jgi:hypothetical protein
MSLDIPDIQKLKVIQDTVFINMLDNGTCAIIMTTKTLVLMEVKVEILGETLKP